MKKFILSAMLFTAICIANPFGNNVAAQNAKSKKEMVAKKYHCPHHPDFVSDKPGKCSCGMELVEMKDMGNSSDTTKMDKKHMKMDKDHMKKDHMNMNMDKDHMNMDMNKDHMNMDMNKDHMNMDKGHMKMDKKKGMKDDKKTMMKGDMKKMDEDKTDMKKKME